MKNLKIIFTFTTVILLSVIVWLVNQNINLHSLLDNCSDGCSGINQQNLHIIDRSVAADLSNNYLESLIELQRSASNSSGKPIVDSLLKDSRSAWFSYDEISSYLCVVKNEYDNIRPEQLKGMAKGRLGLRIYYGRYPFTKEEMKNEAGLGDLADPYAGKHCLFFVPTFDKDPNNPKLHQDFGNASEIDGKLGEKVLLVGSDKNHGALAPPESIIGAYFLEQQAAAAGL